MTATTWIVLTIISLVFSALFSGSEIAYITANRVRVELDVKRGGPLNHIISQFYKHSDLFISTLLVGNNIMLVIYGLGAAYILEKSWLDSLHLNEASVLIISTFISTAIILLVGEFLPKTIFKINPNITLKLFALPLYAFYIILFPISAFTALVSKFLMKICGIKQDQQKMGMLSIGDLNQYLETTIDEVNPQRSELENEVKIFHNALDFSTTHLRDCMIPRNEIVAVNIDTISRKQLSELFTSTGRSKIIVYQTDIDNPLGYIHVSELFNPQSDWKQNIKPLIFAPETLLANKLMRRLLAEKRSMAIVVDEFGGTAGMVTLEDLVEEIFGDIRDEHDKESSPIKQIAPDTYECSGRVEIETLRQQYHIDIPDDDAYQTLAGYILHNLGTIPSENEKLEINNLIFTIKKRTATRLELIQIHIPNNQ